MRKRNEQDKGGRGRGYRQQRKAERKLGEGEREGKRSRVERMAERGGEGRVEHKAEGQMGEAESKLILLRNWGIGTL